MKTPPLALLLAALVLPAAPSSATPAMAQVFVGSARIHVGDVTPGLSDEAAAVDLGPSPSASASRVIQREEIVQALADQGIAAPPGIPPTVRVVRKTKRLAAADLDRMVRQSLEAKLSPGVTLAAVHPAHSVDVPDGWTLVIATVPRPPHHAGAVSTSASVMFYEGTQALWMLSVPVDLMVSAEGAAPDVSHGGRLSLVVRRGLIEVTTPGTVGTDADVGGLVQVVLHPSGRVVLARLEDKDHAIAMDTP